MARSCAWCHGTIPAGTRRDAITCSQPCRQARHRAMRYASGGGLRDASSPARAQLSHGSPRQLAYADPPYPGNSARLYGDHPDYAGEVDHAALLSQLATFDGWALSTSAAALPQVLAEAVAQDLPVRVAAWTRGPRPHATARFPVSSWEPVLYVPVPSSAAGAPRRVDALVHGISPLTTLPSRVVGTKPPAFCRWLFDLVGATPADDLVDLFPGSGIVGRMWELFRAGAVVPAGEDDASAAAGGDVSCATAVAG